MTPAEEGVFLPYDEVVDRLEAVAAQTEGATVLHRGGLAILRLSEGATEGGAEHRPQIWLQAGLHACEWIGPAVVLQVIDELIRDSRLRGQATWYLVPVVDADGYQRSWAGERFLKTTEGGENPNLNFPFQWGVAPALLKLFLGNRLKGWMGPHPGSAGCVQSVMSELASLDNLQLFLDFHGFGRLWLHPWCHSAKPSPHHTEQSVACGIAAAAANRVAARARYRVEAAAKTEAPMGGTCMDFVYGELGCVHSYTVELPPSLPRGGMLRATLRGALGGDPKRWWKQGQDPPAELALEAGREAIAALSALVGHLFGTDPSPRTGLG